MSNWSRLRVGIAQASPFKEKAPLTDGLNPQVVARPVGHAMTSKNSRAARRLA
jgi:hypothetical protein